MKFPLVGAVALVALATPLGAQTAAEIVARNIAARGGAERLRAMQTERLVGHISFGTEEGGPFLVEIARPGKLRKEIGFQGKTIIQVTDGKAGWAVIPGSGSEEARPLTAKELRNMGGGADFEGPLLDYDKKGNNVELVGKTAVRGKGAWKLKITLADGEVRSDYLDAESYLEVKWEGTIRNDGQDRTVETYFSDYRSVNGVIVSFLLESGTPGTSYTQKLVYDSAAVDIPIADDRFGRP